MVGPENVMKFFRLFMLLLILRPCPACLANEVVGEIVATQAVEAMSANAIHDVSECPCPHGHRQGHKPQPSPDLPECPCCSPNHWPAKLTLPVIPPHRVMDAGILLVACDVDFTRSTFAKAIEKTRQSLPDRNDMSLPLLI